MFKKMAVWLAGVATMIAGLGSQACFLVVIEEPTIPKCMIK